MRPADALLAKAAIVGLGANLEDPEAMIKEALRRLEEVPGLKLLAASGIYLTEPQGGPEEQNWYHNAVAFFQSDLMPSALLRILLETELAMGRKRLVQNGPRVIDLDLLAQGEAIINDPPELILPHPRMRERLFVMAPLAEVMPGWRHPVDGRSALDIRDSIPVDGQGMIRPGNAAES